MSSYKLIAIFILMVVLSLFFVKKSEPFLPFYSSPPKRWGSYDLRCVPYIKKKQNFAWNNSSFEYDYREKCLVMS